MLDKTVSPDIPGGLYSLRAGARYLGFGGKGGGVSSMKHHLYHLRDLQATKYVLGHPTFSRANLDAFYARKRPAHRPEITDALPRKRRIKRKSRT